MAKELTAVSIHSPADTSPIVGIDLGTTNSLVAYVRNGAPEVLRSKDGRNLIPSVVSLVGAEPVVGYEAKRNKIRDAAHTAFSVKRLLGRAFQDLADVAERLPYRILDTEGLVRVQLGDRAYTAIEISAMILREAKRIAEQALGEPVHRAVITVPAYFNDSQRQATRMAGRLAGLDVLRIVNEPTAASLAYGLDKKREGLIAVYDFGGGTFDISILKLHDGIFEVLSTNGNTALGGDDLDQALAGVMAEEIREEFKIDPYADTQVRAAMIEAAENVKIALSQAESAEGEVLIRSEVESGVSFQRVYHRVFSREEFEALVRPVLEKTREPCLAALRDAGLKASDLSDVVMVGGPTRLRVVQEVARGIFEREINTSVHPDEVVALGAAIQADILAGRNKDLLLLDVVPLSLGIETYGGLMSPLITRNTRIPTVAREQFTTFVDNQTAVDIHVLQGERERVGDNRSLARFKLHVPPLPAGVARVDVSFLIDADGILQVAAKDLITGNEQAVEVRPSFGLSDAEVEEMLRASQEHAEEDIEVRRLVEVKNKAEPILRVAEKRLPDARRLLPEAEVRVIEQRMHGLRVSLQGSDIAKIQESSRLLNEATVRLAELLVTDAIATAQGGRGARSRGNEGGGTGRGSREGAR